jgi:hypothetical protein
MRNYCSPMLYECFGVGGFACIADSDCCTPETCVNGFCAVNNCYSAQTPCWSGADCCSGSCNAQNYCN